MKKHLFVGSILLLLIITGACAPEPEGPWHPERTDYPRLLYTAADIDSIAARLDHYPYDVLYARVLGMAARTPDLTQGPPYNPGREYTKGNIAKACAFVYVIEGDPADRDKAIEILEAIDPNLEPITYELIQDEIHIAEAVLTYCQAFDMLLGAGDLPEADRIMITGLLTALVEDFFTLWGSTFCLGYEVGGRTNHHTKMAAAIGTAAILLNQHPMARVWIDFAMHGVTKDLDILATADGSHAEGPYYWGYSATNVLPFAWAYRTFTGGVGELFVDRPCKAGSLEQVGEEIYVDNLFTDPTLRTLCDWVIKIRQPDGARPPIDDSNFEGFFNGMVAGVYDDGVYAWDWLESPAEPLFGEHCADLNVDLICAFDETVPPAEPTWNPTQFLTEAGNAVLRSGWGPDDTYVLFLAEYGKARSVGHDHPDGLSFMLYAHGETLAMDSGYIRWEDRDLVRHPKNHNLVLVDGKGAPPYLPVIGGGVDALLTDSFSTSFLDYCSGITAHNQTTHWRALLFPRKRYLLVADDLLGWYAAHDYQWLLHGNGGGSTGGTFTAEADGGLWEIGAGKLRAAVTSVGGAPVLSSYDDYHGHHYAQIETHTVLEASASGRSVRFLSAIVPAAADEPLPAIEVHPDLGGTAAVVVAETDRTGAAFLRPATAAGQPWSLAGIAGHPEFPAFSTDAGLLYLAVEPEGGAVRECFAQGLTSLDAAGLTLASVDAPVTLTVDLGGATIEGHLLAAGGRVLDLYTGGAPAEVSGTSVSGFDYLGDGVTRIHFTGSSDFSVM